MIYRNIYIYRGQNPADAEFNYLDKAKRLEMYGVDLHNARVRGSNCALQMVDFYLALQILFDIIYIKFHIHEGFFSHSVYFNTGFLYIKFPVQILSKRTRICWC